MIARISVLGLISVLVLVGLFLVLRPDPPSATPATRSFDLEIRDGEMSPEEGDRVTMGVSSDRPAEIHHVHGYDNGPGTDGPITGANRCSTGRG